MTARSCRLTALAGLWVFVLFGCGPGGPVGEQPLLTTRAERTRYEQSTGYGEVVQFLERAAALSDRVHVTTFGSTVEGRPLPLAVVGDTIDARPESVTSGDRTRVWLQANIHGGEVCGKEALLMLLRDLVTGEHDDWLSSLTLLIAPIYNADGNELIGPDNRPFQFGPFQGMGVRTNAQGLDLNRDHTKLESPEARALARAYQEYDPHVVVDLHTTNGTAHAYHLTYAPPLHPNTPAAIDTLLRDEWLPAVTEAIKATYGWDMYFYGNTLRGAGAAPTWNTFDHRPRFNNSYVGLRNRVGILSEAYAYAPFDERVAATLRFVEEVLAFASERADVIAALVEQGDTESVVGSRLATRATRERSVEPVEILLGETDEVENPYTRAPMRRRLDTVTPTMMYEYGRFAAAEDGDELAPEAYYVPADLTPVVDLLAAHGVDGAPLDTDTTISAEQFVIAGSSLAERALEGHRERTVEGAWEPVERAVPAGTLVVQVSQPLGRLVFTLLEPRSDD
ncbi:MAG: M14 family metallopeptidase, partial [Vicinamibacterales bacterium]|nr:M14 family metallopeptidase [Vicinamibacterales bacterium]